MASVRHPDSDLIDRVGKERISGTFSLSPQALHMWRRRGIPVRCRIAFAKLAAEAGVPLPENFFESFAA